MNLSGNSVALLISFFKINPAQLIVIHDDFDLDFGLIRIREKGGDGGHKGVRSIIDTLGRGEFIRVRLGIGRPDNNEEGTDYVLSRFHTDQRETLRSQVERAGEAVRTIIMEGTAQAMNQYNQKQDRS
jgi:PTH1 family peptidyl-tRNA hydrolase